MGAGKCNLPEPWVDIGRTLSPTLRGFFVVKWETDFYPVPVLGRIALSLYKVSRPHPSTGYKSCTRNVIQCWCRKAPKAFPDSSSALDKYQSAIKGTLDAFSRIWPGQSVTNFDCRGSRWSPEVSWKDESPHSFLSCCQEKV